MDNVVQLTLSPNLSLAKCFHRVDLGCTEIAFYEGEIQMSPMGKFCVENACVVVLPHGKAAKFVPRLIKYFNKGCDLILPNLNIDVLSQTNFQFKLAEVIVMSDLAVVYTKISKNKVFVQNLQEVGDPSIQSSAFSYSYGSEEDIHNTAEIIHSNIRNLNKGLFNRFQICGVENHIKDVLLPIPILTERMITNSYETVLSSLEEMATDRNFAVSKLEAYFVVRPVSVMLRDLIVTPAELKEAWLKEHESDEDAVYSTDDAFRRCQTHLGELVNAQKADTGARVLALQEKVIASPADFRIVSDEWRGEAEQYTAAIAAEWFGSSFAEFEVSV
jgi:hypothetical protein